MAKVRNAGFWACPLTGRHSEKPRPDWVYWASSLEKKVNDQLVRDGVIFVRQFQVLLLDSHQGIPATTWDSDFFAPATNELIEAKGAWINDKENSAEKALFILKVKLALLAGYKVTVLGSQDFTIGTIEVKNYRTISWR
jgi:hypothetical protein